MQIIWAGVSTEIALGCGPNNHTEINQWMDDLNHMFGFVYKNASVKANRTKPKTSTLYLVQTKASELADFPGVNLTFGIYKIGHAE